MRDSGVVPEVQSRSGGKREVSAEKNIVADGKSKSTVEDQKRW